MVVTPIKSSKLRLACVATFPPRRCGIGTFSYDLCNAVSDELASSESCQVVAINDIPEAYDYDDRVCFDILDEDISEYSRAADFLNIRGVSVILLQHEFGIYGGANGSHVLSIMRESRMPVITTLHTILSDPSPHQREVFEELAGLSGPAPAAGSQMVRYEKALSDCSAQLRLLIEKVAALEVKLDALGSRNEQAHRQIELSPRTAFGRHDALMYVARAAVCDKVRQKNITSIPSKSA